MTMPNERTRALRWAGEFLRELRRLDLPEEIARQIPYILRHYPSSEDIAHQAKHGYTLNGRPWLAPEDPKR